MSACGEVSQKSALKQENVGDVSRPYICYKVIFKGSLKLYICFKSMAN